MPIVAIVVGAIGTAVGTAVGAAIGGTILGVSAATIGGVIGAGIAGGALAAATGGSFGKGFLMGAIGGAVGGFLKGGLGDIAAAGTEGMTEQATMLAAQGGAEFAPDALSGLGDLGATGATTGLGEMGGTDVGGMSSSGTGDLFGGGTPDVGGMSQVPTPEGGFSLDTLTGGEGAVPSLAESAGFGATPTPSLGSDQFALTPGTANGSPLLSTDYSTAPTNTSGGGGLENIGQGYVQPADGTTTGQVLEQQGGAAFAPNNTSQGLGGTIRNMANTSDAWLKDTFGQGAPSTGKLLMGGGQFLMDKYQTDALARQAKGLAPMSFEQYQKQFTNPEDYRQASRQLAQSGRTGTLPALLARMKERARQGYAGYLPGARQQYLGVQADISGARSRSLGNLFKNVMA